MDRTTDRNIFISFLTPESNRIQLGGGIQKPFNFYLELFSQLSSDELQSEQAAGDALSYHQTSSFTSRRIRRREKLALAQKINVSDLS